MNRRKRARLQSAGWVAASAKDFLGLTEGVRADGGQALVLYEIGHAPPRKELIRESLDWLDKYLGPVKR